MKTLILFVFFAGSVFISSAQLFSQGVGLTTVMESGVYIASSASLGVVYAPKLNFPVSKIASVSVRMPVSIGGVNVSTNLKNGFGSGYDRGFFYTDVPLMADFNIGAGATRKAKNSAGFFVGGGLGYHRRISVDDQKIAGFEKNVSGFAPVVNIGARFATRNRKHNVEIKTSLQKVSGVLYSNILSTSMMYNF